MKHDWYLASLKRREPNLEQAESLFNGRAGFYWVKQKRKGFYAPVYSPPLPNPSAPCSKSAGIKTAIQELKDLFCKPFKRDVPPI